jgi:hypothetical protein
MGKSVNIKVVNTRTNIGDRRQDSNWDLRPETGNRREQAEDRRRDKAEMR